MAVLCARSEPREAYLAVMAGNTCKFGRQIDLGHVTAKLWYSRAIERKGKYSFVCGAEDPRPGFYRRPREEGVLAVRGASASLSRDVPA